MITDQPNQTSFLNIRLNYWIIFFLVTATLAVYGQVRNFEFVNFDDPLYVTDNPYVQQGINTETFIWSFTGATRETNYWAPLTWLSILLDYQLYGMNSGGFHLTNVILHISSTLLLFIALEQMTGMLWRSAFVAALFALHPLHVESVAWVTERKDVLSTFFWMLTMLTYAGYARRPGRGRYLLVFLCFTMGLMAKPMVVTLPFVLLLLDYWPLARFQLMGQDKTVNMTRQMNTLTQVVCEKAPFFILVAVICVMTYLTQREGGAVKSLAEYPLNVRFANALVTYLGYIAKMFWPNRLAFLYPHPGPLPFWQASAAGIILLAITLAAVKYANQRPYFIFGWLWYIGTLVPVIGLIVIGPYVQADRYTYIPLIGLFIMIAWGISGFMLPWRHGKAVLTALSLFILILLSAASWRQVGHWRDSITLCKHAIAVTRNNLTAYNHLSVALYNSGRKQEAVKYYLEALQIDPGYLTAYFNLGMIYKNHGNLQASIRQYQMALKIDPDSAFAHNNLASILASLGKDADAIKHYRKALEIDRSYANAHYNLGTVLQRQGKFKEAIDNYLEALKIDPFYAEAHHHLGNILAKQGRTDEASAHFREALRIRPDDEVVRKDFEKIAVRREK